MSAPQAVEDYATGYAKGYLEALEHVQDLLTDESDWYLQGGDRTKATLVLHNISRILDAWKDEWEETHA